MAKRIITHSGTPEWQALFRSFTSTAFRLETLQHYSVPSELAALARFLEEGQPDFTLLTNWTSMVRENAAAGRKMSRVRIVVEPPTDYTRFELANYPLMIEAGDAIQVIATPAGSWPADLPKEDFWLFDDHDLWILHYGDAGDFQGAELIDDLDVIEQHRTWRDIAIELAIPVADYMAHATWRAT